MTKQWYRPDFTPLLKELKQDTPTHLFYRGTPQVLARPTIAIVGSRDATYEATQFAERMGAVAAEVGIVVVSGAARGIDMSAHLGAVKRGGASVAVLGRPLEESVPDETRIMFDTLVRQGGCVLSELRSGAGFHRMQYLQRNRIIAGCSPVTVVVSAQIRSGALNTASWAKKFGRDLWAVPANPWELRGQGTNRLIHEGALSISTIEVFREAIFRHYGLRVAERMEEEDRLLKHLSRVPSHPSELKALLGEQVTLQLVKHEAQGRVKRLHDGRYTCVH